MFAAVCGRKKSYFFNADAPLTPGSKKLQCHSSSTSSPRCFSPPSYLPHLEIAFPIAQPEEQIEVLVQKNHILKKAIAIQHERQKDFDDKNRELLHLKQLVSQYQEQLTTLEFKKDGTEDDSGSASKGCCFCSILA